MHSLGPQYLLFTAVAVRPDQPARWRFELRPVDPHGKGERIAAADLEYDADASRLELLAVVRGLEALPQPSKVTLLSASRHVRRAIQHDLAQWREQGWRWERFGRLVAIRDQDLWERIDRAVAIHHVDCWPWSSRGVNESRVAAEVAISAGSGHLSDPSEIDQNEGGQIVVLRHGYFMGGRSALSRTA